MWLYDLNPPPPWIYTKASSAYTTLIQLYACSGQLAMAGGMCQKKALTCQTCRFGCSDTENPHHIFVACGQYLEMQSKELEWLVTSIKNKWDDAQVDPHDQTRIMNTAKFIFPDSKNVWPLQSSMYFLGQIPKLEPLLPPLSMISPINCSRLIHNLATDMHLASACLALRIYGDLQKEMVKRHDETYGTRK